MCPGRGHLLRVTREVKHLGSWQGSWWENPGQEIVQRQQGQEISHLPTQDSRLQTGVTPTSPLQLQSKTPPLLEEEEGSWPAWRGLHPHKQPCTLTV